jgi:microcystin-dependent protein
MSDTPYVGEIRMLSFNFAPRGWALCNGQLLPINQNQPLFALIGTVYGGDGRVNFALPNLQGRAAMHESGAHPLGQTAGEEWHTLTVSEMPEHNHLVNAMPTTATDNAPAGNLLAAAHDFYGSATDLTTLAPGSIANGGGSQPHENRQPYLVLNYCIALSGIFPSRN